ncbi:unnamed protein product [Rotaria magnacalcarata]|uniref:Uncharacterized protein n=2 Tax=Rotaria magnacalcarata TaxID=392030 RepID=A0A816DRL5_9BILA|nr:unnamed protein product [Rotaria magnacalcarata]
MVKCIYEQYSHGKLCQFTTKRFGLSLDVILGCQIQPNVPFLRQLFPIKISALLVTAMGIIGLCGTFLSILPFHSTTIRE